MAVAHRLVRTPAGSPALIRNSVPGRTSTTRCEPGAERSTVRIFEPTKSGAGMNTVESPAVAAATASVGVVTRCTVTPCWLSSAASLLEPWSPVPTGENVPASLRSGSSSACRV
jgi:hypothetical protein